MKIYVITDLEGTSGVDSWSQTGGADSDKKKTGRARELLTGEVNACVEGIKQACPKAQVTVWDGHGVGGLNTKKLTRRAKLFRHNELPGPPYRTDASYDALFYVGQHAMAGTKGATLCHTYDHRRIEYYKLNGRRVGEFGARSLMAATLGVPTVFLAGDDKAVAEAKKLVPGIFGAAVKQSRGWQKASHLAPAASQARIRETAIAAVATMGRIRPPKITPPYRHEIRVFKGVSIDWYLEKGYLKKDARTVVKMSDDICKLLI